MPRNVVSYFAHMTSMIRSGSKPLPELNPRNRFNDIIIKTQ